MVAAGKPSWSLGVKLVTTMLNVVALSIAVRGGIVAVAAAFVVSSLAAAPLSLLAVRNVVPFDVRVYLKQCVMPLMATLAMVAVLFGFRQLPFSVLGNFGQLAVLVAVGAVSYLVVLQIAAPSLTAQVLDFVRSLFPRPNAMPKAGS
jgi:hypothetical protein